jgi:hypothetical protein
MPVVSYMEKTHQAFLGYTTRNHIRLYRRSAMRPGNI